MAPNVYRFPLHKRVWFSRGTDEALFADNIEFVYDDDLSFSISSQFGAIIESRPNTLMSLLSSSISIGGQNIPSGQYSLQSFQVWQSTEPMEFNLNLKLYANTSGYKDVIVPSMELAKYSVPSKGTSGPLGYGLIPPGPNIQDILKGAVESGGVVAKIAKILVNSNTFNKKHPYGGLVNVHVGNCWVFPNCVLTKVTPTYSEAKMSENYGGSYTPMFCDLSVDFRTSEVCTVDMITDMVKIASPTYSPKPVASTTPEKKPEGSSNNVNQAGGGNYSR